MSEAAAVFYNGLHLEGKMAEVLAQVGERDIPTFAVAECIEPAELIVTDETASLHDPHVWFDISLWKQCAACVADALAAVDPSNAESYQSNAHGYVAQLETLHSWVQEEVGSLPAERRVLVTAHDAFAYFGRAYGFEVRGLMGVSTAAEAGTADVSELATFIVSRRIPALVVESSVSPRFVEALQEAVAAQGLKVAIGGQLYSDALGDTGSSASSYLGTFRSNVNTIVAALSSGRGAEE
jgi:manganese/zinc/iron transport system substrate-binding protein